MPKFIASEIFKTFVDYAATLHLLCIEQGLTIQKQDKKIMDWVQISKLWGPSFKAF